MKKHYLFVILLFHSLYIFSQLTKDIDKIFPGSPEAIAFSEYGKVPVNLHNGLLDLKLPLLELKGRNMNIPLTLSYHSAGNKVDEISSSIGLGWTLNAGGVITRVVRGRNDEDVNGYSGKNKRGKLINDKSITSMSDEEKRKFISGNWDSEPDIFYFNVLGHSGSFIINQKGEIIMRPENDFKILPAIGPKKVNNYWTLIDKKGFKYNFGVNNTDIENQKVSRSGYEGPHITFNFPDRNFNSSWYLSNIITPTNEVFNFEYTNGLKTEFNTITEGYSKLGNSYRITTTKTQILNPVILSKITSEFGYIEIDNKSRLDIKNGAKIVELKLYNYNSVPIKTVKFNQTYFNSKENCNAPECKRLKLLEVIEEYPSKDSIKKYKFNYNTTKLPRRGSPEIDHWGYYNSNNQSNLIPRSDPLNVNTYRTPNEATTKASILTKITYPTGGYSEFSFGLNQCKQGSYNINTGGLRIESVTKKGEDIISPLTTRYEYSLENSSISSGIQYNLPVYKKESIEIYDPSPGGAPISFDNILIESSSYNELLDLKGSNVGYGNINIRKTDNGEEILKYSTLESNPNLIKDSNYFSLNDSNKTSLVDPYGSPFGPPSENKFYQRGLLIEKILKDNEGNKVEHVLNNYQEINHSKLLRAIGYKFSLTWTYAPYSLYEVNCSKYSISNNSYKIESSTTTNYNITGQISKMNKYKYSFKNPTIIKEEKITLSNGDKKRVVYNYPFDEVNEINDIFNQKNQINDYTHKTEYLNNELLNFEKRVYKYETPGFFNNGKIPLQTTIRYRKKDSKDYNLITIDKYDLKGNVLQYHKNDSIPTSIIWGYGDRYPIAKIEDHNIISITKTAVIKNAVTASNSDENQAAEIMLRNKLELLREAFPEAQVTTFTYDPLIGVTSITDPRGETVYYEYDNLNRLKFIKDAQGNLIQETKYNYKN